MLGVHLGLRGSQVQVAPGVSRQVAPGLQGAALVDQVLPAFERKFVAGLDARPFAGEILPPGAVAHLALVADNRALVGEGARGGTQADVTPCDHATGAVAEVVVRCQVQGTAGLHKAAVGQAAVGQGVERAAGFERAGVGEVATADQGHITALDKSTEGRRRPSAWAR
ncbi:hypothetical protein LN139_22580 [Pseudomonas sp. KNUC1026]|nr:hypothetical protein [Pseudomonas sp. KNUC1026]UFH49553.1 hypothetical protein LN139_22580 [Pseudomonas sp. KNUC1026]